MMATLWDWIGIFVRNLVEVCPGEVEVTLACPGIVMMRFVICMGVTKLQAG